MSEATGTTQDELLEQEPWRSWIGRKTDVIFCEDEVNLPQIKYFCSAVQDANPIYWDKYEAIKRHGSAISPPGMLMVWSMPQPWRPDGTRELPMLAIEVPTPGDTMINASTETEFLRPMRVGDQLNFQEEIVEISPEKKTRLGVGRFITAMTTYRNQAGEVVALHKNILFRYFANTQEASE